MILLSSGLLILIRLICAYGLVRTQLSSDKQGVGFHMLVYVVHFLQQGEFYQMKTFARQIFFLSFWPHSYIPLNSYQVIRDYAESQIYSERSSNPYCCRTYAIIASSLIGIDGYFSTTKIAQSVRSRPNEFQYYGFGKYTGYPIRKSPCWRY